MKLISNESVDFTNPAVLEILTEFLFRCKNEAWAGGVKYADSASFPGLKTFSTHARYIKGRPLYPDLEFRDEYLGHYNFAGRELVLNAGAPIWQMNYFGSTKLGPNVKLTKEEQKNQSAMNEEVFEFLREAVSQMPERLPLRGPSEYHNGGMTYICTVTGDIREFYGREEITCNFGEGKVEVESLVYSLNFHGGILIPRSKK